MTTYYDDAEPLGLPPLYEKEPPRRHPRLRHACVYAVILVVTMVATALVFNALGEPDGGMSMTCWNSGDHNHAIVCDLQPPATYGPTG